MVIICQILQQLGNTHNVREVKVQAGDTMWDIAARSAHKDMDVREMVYAMKELNNISDSGNLYLVPV